MDDTNYTSAACHLCGEIWHIPLWIADQINANNPYECPNCKKKKILEDRLKYKTF